MLKVILPCFLVLSAVYPVYPEDQKEDFYVTGIIHQGTHYEALVNDKLVRPGDSIAGGVVAAINDTVVMLRRGNTTVARSPGEGVVRKEIQREWHVPTLEETARQKVEWDEYETRMILENVEYYVARAERCEKALDLVGAFRNHRKVAEYAALARDRLAGKQKDAVVGILAQASARLQEMGDENRYLVDMRSLGLDTPRKISDWMRANFEYRTDSFLHKQPDYWQTPQESLALRSGDCEDAAFLIQALLRENNIVSTVIAVSFTRPDNPTAGHALCIFPADNPRYYFSNQYYFDPGKSVDLAFIQTLFPTCTSVWLLDLYNRKGTILYRSSS
jgi:predicted transglutaminase-like cysteine proteinase